jgi:hypothetical protein
MMKNIVIKLKGSIGAIAFCLLCGSIVSVAYADSNDLEIAFATVSGEAGNLKKTAGCIIVLSTIGEKTQNIYCRYELDKDKVFKRDDDVGFNLNNVNFVSSINKETFQGNIKNWFENNSLNPTPTSTDLSYFVDAVSRLSEPTTHYFEPKAHHYHFVLKDPSALRSNEQFAIVVHNLIKEKIPEKVIEEAKAVTTKVQNNGKAAKKEVEKVAEQAKTNVEKIGANVEKIGALEQSIVYIHIFIVLFCLLFIPLFIWLFLASRKTTSFNEEIVNMKKQHKVQYTTLQKCVSEMEEKITQLSPVSFVKEPQVENESSSQDSDSDNRKKIRQLEGEKKEAQSVIGQLKGENRDLAERQRSEQDAHQQVEDDLKSQLKAEKNTHQETAIFLANSQQELKKLNQQNKMLETYLKNSKDEYEKESAQRQEVEQTLVETKQEVDTLSHAEKTLQNVLFKRFRLIKPKEMDFTVWTTALRDQKGSWFWLQPTLLGELLICELIFNHIKKQGAKRDQEILKLLYFDSIMAHWRKLVAQLFETNDKLWVHLRDIDSRQWLTQLLRADDVLKTYFPKEKSFDLLSQHLSNVNGILRAALIEMGVTKILAPKILEAVPNYVPAEKDRNQLYAPNTQLKALVKEKVQSRLKEMPQFVVDVQRYGFCTADNPDDAGNVQVFVINPSEWE